MSKRYTLLLSSVLLLFVLLCVLLCWYSRLATDDFYFIWDVRHHGIIKGVTSQYMEWCGRFAATFLMDVIYKWGDTDQTWYFLFPLSSFLLLITGIYRLITNTLLRLSLQLRPLQRGLLALSFTALLFFLSSDIAETWFWYCSLSSYLWSIIAFVWGTAMLLSKKHPRLTALLAAVCFIYAGGASEVYSVLYGVTGLALLCMRYRETAGFSAFVENSFNRRLLLLLIILAISFLLFLVAPGNYLRDELFPEHQFFYSFFITAKSIVKFFIFYLPSRLAGIAAFAIPFAVTGQSVKAAPVVPLKKIIIRSTLALAFLLLLFFFIVAYVMVETGPPRIWFILSFFLAVYFSVISFYAGCSGFFSKQKMTILRSVSLVLGAALLLFHLFRQVPLIRRYAKAHDGRLASLSEMNKKAVRDTLIVLQPLPPPGMLYSSEIGSDTSHFTNKELRLGYELKFHVTLKPGE